ncbi:hypothetical protein TNCV_1503991 [Trichonephila clavipes]|uniref:Uncharacterized protein n=1 Tax=Trichonephila clavipes TaxID=2585209 RepID=A0A8X6V8Y6_TRICX|nr:hypothetical protein TNCV_1503991 [Trichonephila clavipes]
MGSSNGSSRSHPGKSRRSRKPSGDESKSSKSNKGTAGLDDLRLKRKNEPEGIREEHWNRQSNAELLQEKEPQHGSLRRRSG